ncbi:hypothetical protein J3998_02760 [Thiomicrorhabdus sp. 6S2-11]|uniref:Uncharacterized protein n=1 Tax=Thiomicrorhabdus marina TaxID=2818442 RepID=A0ABS3Q3G8_9GAMM|nr:hypothetical protein [Thiomicrorhabdus marina]MBO1926484.1 hypothetical protein [Thiomicrorhabdus marina]
MKEFLFIIREIIVIIFTGGIPVLIAYIIGGEDELEKTISGLLAPEIFLYYSIIPPILFATLHYTDKYFYINPTSKFQSTLNFTISIFHELSSNIIGIFRLASGILISIPILVLVVEPESFNSTIQFIPYGILSGIEVVIFYWWFSKIEIKFKSKLNAHNKLELKC